MADQEKLDRFVQLFSEHQLRLYRYIVTLISNHVDAEEVFQNANLVMWKKFDDFQLDTNFYAWACRIAYLEVLKYRQQHRRAVPSLSDELLEQLAAEAVEKSDLLERRHRALADCLEKLPPGDVELIQARYSRGISLKDIAHSLGRTADSVRHSACRIRRALKRCIDRTLAAEEHP